MITMDVFMMSRWCRCGGGVDGWPWRGVVTGCVGVGVCECRDNGAECIINY